MNRNLRQAIELIKSFEGVIDGDPANVNLDPYICPAGHWTIGWGHVVRDPQGRPIKGVENKQHARAVYPTGLTMIEAEVLLGDDVRRFSAGVEKLLQVKVSDAQFCALVSFAYNVGVSALERSTLLQVINRGNFDQVPAQFLRWTKTNGKELAGLKRRRQAEANLWRNA